MRNDKTTYERILACAEECAELEAEDRITEERETAQTQQQRSDLPPELARELIAALEAVGMGAPGRSTTLFGMVRELIAEVELLRTWVEALEADSKNRPLTIKRMAETIHTLKRELDASLASRSHETQNA